MQLKNIAKERNNYLDEINQLKLELNEAKRLIDNQYNNSNYDNLEDNSQSELGFFSIIILIIGNKYKEKKFFFFIRRNL